MSRGDYTMSEVELTTRNGHKFRLVIHKDPTLAELSAKQAISEMGYRRHSQRRPPRKKGRK